MRNIVKIVSVLSGLLVFSAANAGELAVTGSMEATYKTGGTDGTVGNPLGMDRELKFAGSTELDNGMTVSVMQDTSDALAFGNSQIAIASDLGTLYLGSDSDPVDSIDDITPSAYEEANGSGPSDFEGYTAIHYADDIDSIKYRTWFVNADGDYFKADDGDSDSIAEITDADEVATLLTDSGYIA